MHQSIETPTPPPRDHRGKYGGLGGDLKLCIARGGGGFDTFRINILWIYKAPHNAPYFPQVEFAA